MARQPPIHPLLEALLAMSADPKYHGATPPVYVPGADHPFPYNSATPPPKPPPPPKPKPKPKSFGFPEVPVPGTTHRQPV
jgi:hypothetical protein